MSAAQASPFERGRTLQRCAANLGDRPRLDRCDKGSNAAEDQRRWERALLVLGHGGRLPCGGPRPGRGSNVNSLGTEGVAVGRR